MITVREILRVTLCIINFTRIQSLNATTECCVNKRILTDLTPRQGLNRPRIYPKVVTVGQLATKSMYFTATFHKQNPATIKESTVVARGPFAQ